MVYHYWSEYMQGTMLIHYILQYKLYDVLRSLATNKLGLYPSGKVVYTHYKIIGRITPHTWAVSKLTHWKG